jgi:hypothetical protein
MTYVASRQQPHAALTAGNHAVDLTFGELDTMLRQPSNDTRTVSDWELGVAAMLLLVTVLLAVLFVPAVA